MQAVRNRSISDSRKKMLREMNGVPDGWITTGGAMEYLNLSKYVIKHATINGQLPYQKFGELYCYTKEALDAFDAQRRNLPVSDTTDETDTPPQSRKQPLNRWRQSRKRHKERPGTLLNRDRSLHRSSHPVSLPILQKCRHAMYGPMCRLRPLRAKRRNWNSQQAA